MVFGNWSSKAMTILALFSPLATSSTFPTASVMPADEFACIVTIAQVTAVRSAPEPTAVNWETGTAKDPHRCSAFFWPSRIRPEKLNS